MGNRTLASGLAVCMAAWLTCRAAPAAEPTSAPAATAPATSAPVTSAPATTAPATSAPATTAPAAKAPATSAPTATAPAATAPAVEPTVQPKFVLPKGPRLKPVARPEVFPKPLEPVTAPATTAPTSRPAPATSPAATAPATTAPTATAPAATAPAVTTHPVLPTTKPRVTPATAPATTAPVAGRSVWTDHSRATARQAARAQAVRQLARQIADVRIGPDQALKYLAEESEDFRCALEAVLACTPDSAPPKYLDDGQCEVTLAATPRGLEDDIRLALTRYYKGEKLKPADAARLPIQGVKALLATGRAAAPHAPAEGEMVPVEGTAPAAVPPGAAKFWNAHCTLHGRLAAERAAREDALRNLSSRVLGLPVGPEVAGTAERATVADLIAASDDPKVDVRKFVRGANLVGVRYHLDELVVEARMAVSLRTVYATLRSWGLAHLRTQRDTIRRLEELAVKADNSSVQATGLGAPAGDQIKNVTPVMKRAAALAAAAPNWATQTVRSIGQAKPAADIDAGGPQRGLQAAWHAAEIDARIRLARHLASLPVAGGPTLRDLAARNDDVAAALLAFQQSGVIPPEFRRVRSDGMAELALEVDLRPLWQAIVRCQARAE